MPNPRSHPHSRPHLRLLPGRRRSRLLRRQRARLLLWLEDHGWSLALALATAAFLFGLAMLLISSPASTIPAASGGGPIPGGLR